MASEATALAPGFRFHPTDEELVRYYLIRKVRGKSFRFDAIVETDIYKTEPWDLPGKSTLKTRDSQWYFFSALDKKYGNGSRMNRATGKGYWKATGNDRLIKHDMRVIGLKKTLVFHSGRAPGGNRTNWVMHEYRLADEELEKMGKNKRDTYVLCRVFEKSNLGPPNGNQYASFVDDEWDDDGPVLVPGRDAGDEGAVGDDTHADGNGHGPVYVARDDAYVENNHQKQDTESHRAPLSSEHSSGFHDVPVVCKRERFEDSFFPSIDTPELQAVENKRPRIHDLDPNHLTASETSKTSRNFSSTLVELPLLDSVETRARESFTLPCGRFDSLALDLSVPPAYLEFVNNLQKEIHNIAIERETLKIEVMSAEAMINILQSRIEYLNRENENFRRLARDA